ncbi:MAG: hypothetical protein LBI02_04625 [Opitutaceae bacterium]|jgi:hypothetical protein|nr:hypothetical protein [Opitutaceae bacterium]
MNKVPGIILKAVAGFFFYAGGLLAFISEPPQGVKLVLMLVFLLPAVLALIGGLSLTRFRNWKRDTGIVLLSASGVTTFVIFTIIWLSMSEEFRSMIRPEHLTFFNDYQTGGGVIAGLAVMGWILVKTNKESKSRVDQK